MSAGKHGSSEVTVTYDTSPGGSGVAITNHVLQMGGAKIESIQQMTDALGDAWEESSPTGKRRVPPIDLEGFFDDTATTGPHTVLRVTDDDVDPNGSTRTLVLVFGNSKTFTVETRLAEYEVIPDNSKLTKFKAKIVPTGVGTWS